MGWVSFYFCLSSNSDLASVLCTCFHVCFTILVTRFELHRWWGISLPCFQRSGVTSSERFIHVCKH